MRVVLLGDHLGSAPRPGINDNGTGTIRVSAAAKGARKLGDEDQR